MTMTMKDKSVVKFVLEMPAVLVDDDTGEELDVKTDLYACLAKRSGADLSKLDAEGITAAAKQQALSVLLNTWFEGRRMRREEGLKAIGDALLPAAKITTE